MATTDQYAEFDSFAEPLVASGRYSTKEEVLHAAIDALRISELTEDEINARLIELAEEGEASGLAEGDVIARIREKHGLRPSKIFG